MNILLLRHAETKANERGLLSSGSEDGLTDKGMQQARDIVRALLELDVEHVLCSPYQRAINTISPFAKMHGKEIEIVPCLAEGQLVMEDHHEKEKPAYVTSMNGYMHSIEEETKGQFLSRAAEAVTTIESQNVSKLLVVTHGHMIRELLNSLLSLNPKVRFPHDNCGLSCVSITGNSKPCAVNFINRDISLNQ